MAHDCKYSSPDCPSKSLASTDDRFSLGHPFVGYLRDAGLLKQTPA